MHPSCGAGFVTVPPLVSAHLETPRWVFGSPGTFGAWRSTADTSSSSSEVSAATQQCPGAGSDGAACSCSRPSPFATACASQNHAFVPRLWRSLTYECVYLNAFETGSEARRGIGAWISYYNEKRPHSSHGLLTPAEAYDTANLKAAA